MAALVTIAATMGPNGSIIIFWVPLNLEGADIGRTGPEAGGLRHRERCEPIASHHFGNVSFIGEEMSWGTNIVLSGAVASAGTTATFGFISAGAIENFVMGISFMSNCHEPGGPRMATRMNVARLTKREMPIRNGLSVTHGLDWENTIWVRLSTYTSSILRIADLDV